MNRDLFLAILSMDSYNRGYGFRINNLDETGRLGDATLLAATSQQQSDWQSAGFYAIAYNVNGETIISYRGTDNVGPNLFDASNDFWSYGIRAGDPYNLSGRGSGYGTTVGLTKLRKPLN